MDAAAAFHLHCREDRGADALYLPGWGVDDVRALFALGDAVTLQPGEALLRQGENERAIYLVVSGALEVSSGVQLSQTMGRLIRAI